MKPQDIIKLKSLDPTGCNGTIQFVLTSKDLAAQPLEPALWWLLQQTLIEKETLAREGKKYVRVLKENGLYTNELIMEV